MAKRSTPQPGDAVRHALNHKVRGRVVSRTEHLGGKAEIRVSYIASNNDPSDRWDAPEMWEIEVQT